MTSFFFWILLKLAVLFVAGYFISQLLQKTKADNEVNQLSKQYEEHLIENSYPYLKQDIEAALTITGLKMSEQKYPLHLKPVFYFKLSRQNTRDEIRGFLNSLPAQFVVVVPSLKVSIEDSLLQTICFWKYDEKFQLALKKRDAYKILGVTGTGELTEKIHEASTEFNFQNISVERLII